MTNERDHSVFITQREDGSWLAASVSTPWFCVSAPSEAEVKAKAQRALDAWSGNRHAPLNRDLKRAVTPFAPVEKLALCA